MLRMLSRLSPRYRSVGAPARLASGGTEGKPPLPSSAQVVVCGGGVVGASVAYHLPRVGFKDVLLLEQGSLSCGTTWHSAGLLGRLRASHTHTRITTYGCELYPALEEETGLGTGCKDCGALTLATNKDRLTALRRLLAVARYCGVEAELVSAREAAKLCPVIRTDDLLAALWSPGVSAGNPSDICQALARGATQKGVQVCEGVRVEGVDVKEGRVTGVKTDSGDIQCEMFVNCGGQWAREVGLMSDPPVNIPLHSTQHFYLITKPMEGVEPMMPVVRDYCAEMYSREWSGGILAGCFEGKGKPCFQGGIPDGFQYQLLPEDWDHCQPLIDAALHRFPGIASAEIRQMTNGPESFTPDQKAAIGQAPDVDNYFVAAGMNSLGIVSAAGFGRALAEWMAAGEPPSDLWEYDVARFGTHEANGRYRSDRAVETLARLYCLPWPLWERETGRAVKTTPFHDRLETAGASWGTVMGWERPNWFAGGMEERENEKTFGRPSWLQQVAEEHKACREKVAMFDMSAFAKFEVEGASAEEALQKLCANNVAMPEGRVVYTGMLNSQGGYQTDCTVTRLTPDKFLVVCPSAQAVHAAAWVRRHLPGSVSLRDVSHAYSVLAVMGPLSRDLLSQTTPTSLDNHAFPFGTAQTIEVGLASGVRALRVSFMGELGWELHIPTQYALGVYDELVRTGSGCGLRLAGTYAMDSLRLEKHYRHWGHELDTETTPLEARLMFAVDMNKGDFIGREVLSKQRAEGVRRMLGVFTVDTQEMAWGHENIYRNGVLVGYATSAGYCHTLGELVVMGYVSLGEGGRVTSKTLSTGSYELEISGQRYPAQVHMQPLYDPTGSRVKM